MKNAFLVIMATLAFASCQQGSKYQYTIVSEEPNSAFKKCNLVIELPEKISKEELTAIATELRESRKEYDRLWIAYYLPGMKVGAGAWAVTNYTPELEMEFVGSTIDEEKVVRDAAKSVDGKLLGSFLETQYTSGSYAVYEKDGKTYIKITYKSGEPNVEEMVRSQTKDGIRLDYKNGGSAGEYFILRNNRLEFYNSEGKNFTVGEPI